MKYFPWNKKNQKGQALAEMTVAMIAILAMISGFLIIAQLSRASIENLLRARADSDINSFNGIYGNPGSPIRYWGIGDDLMEISPDDQAMTMTSDNPALFSSQLSSGGLNLGSLGAYAQNNFAATMSSDYLFLDSANLTSANENTEIDLDDASRFLYGGTTLFGLPTVTIENTVYMPVVSD